MTGSEAALTGLGLLNTLFVALAAGLWMSTVFRERRYAVPATLGLVAALAFGPEVLGGSYFGMGAVPFFRLFGLAGWMTAAHLPGLFKLLFVVWFMMMNALGWLFLWRAGATLAAGLAGPTAQASSRARTRRRMAGPRAGIAAAGSARGDTRARDYLGSRFVAD